MDPVNTPRTEKVVLKSKSNMNFVIGGFVVLVVALIAVTTYFLMTSKTNCDVDNTDTQTTLDENDEGDLDIEENDDSAPVVVKESNMQNSDWALFVLPKYEVSVEYPSYTMEWEFNDMDVLSKWFVEYSYVDTDLVRDYSDYLQTVYLSFLPEDLSVFGCGDGCARESNIKIMIFANKGANDLDTVKSVVRNNLIEDGARNVTPKSVTKWGSEVVEFTVDLEQASYTKYLFVNDSYVYTVSYSNSNEASKESIDIAQKVLDSIKFGVK